MIRDKRLFESIASAIKFNANTLILLMLLCTLPASAQVTSSTITGNVTDGVEPLPGALVLALHEPSGTRYTALANGEGEFRLEGLRTGGPYRLEATFVGFNKGVVEKITLRLGETYRCQMALQTNNQLDEVVIIGKGATELKTGASNHITRADINATPNISRNLNDLARLSPYFMDGEYGGRNGGMNNFSIDGSNFNYNMGLDRVKLPGGGTPISVDAIEEIQVVTSAFDVKQSNFMGASINAITKSGTNNLSASAYGYFKNEHLRGNKVDDMELSARQKEQRNIYGFTVGGPIVKNKLFYFVNAEYEDIPYPIHKWRLSTDGKEDAQQMISRVTAADMERFANDLISMYGYNPGSWTDFNGKNNSFRVISRFDWNINDHHHLMVRYNQVNTKKDNNVVGAALSLGQAPTSIYSQTFRNSTWKSIDNVYSLSAELSSNFGWGMSNVLRGSFTFNDANNRECEGDFPTVDILKEDDGGVSRAWLNAGYDQHAWRNGIKEKSWSVTDNFTISTGRHQISLGGAFESTTASNCYMRYGAGYYRYASYDDFINKRAPIAFAFCYSLTGEERALADITYNRLSFYAQDEWNVNDRFNIQYGVRMDMPMYTNHRYENPAVAELDFNGKKLNTGEWPKSIPLFAPRLGFNYKLDEEGSIILRGGTGIFTGRFPLIILSKMQERSGMLQHSIQIKDKNDPLLKYFEGKGILTPNQILAEVPNMPEELRNRFPQQAGASATASNLVTIDRKFKMPQLWKSTLAIDFKLPTSFDAGLTLEGSYSKDINAMHIYDANIDPAKATANQFEGPDQRYFYPGRQQSLYYADRGYAYVLTNTTKGYSANFVAQAYARPVQNLHLMAAYTYTVSKTIDSMNSNQIENMASNLPTVNGYNYATVGNALYLRSPHRVLATATYRINYARNHASTDISLLYEGRHGAAYSYTYDGDMNNDGVNNDLLYIPANKEELIFQDKKVGDVTFTADEQRDAFWAFINKDPYLKKHKGEYAKANAAYSPWMHRFDLRVVQEFGLKVGKKEHRLQLNLDVMNIGNLLNSKWGTQKTTQAGAPKPLKRVGVTENNQPIYTMSTYKDSEGQNRLVDKTFTSYLNSNNCWQLQLGVRYLFH